MGRSVIAQTGKAVVDTSKNLNGTVVLPASANPVTLKISDAEGKTIRTIDMGSQSAGNASFIWDGKTMPEQSPRPARTPSLPAQPTTAKRPHWLLTCRQPSTA